MTTLFDLCSLIRSKNAGPFMLTFDLMFSTAEHYALAKRSKALTPNVLAEIYSVPFEQIVVVYHEAAMALKISMPRPIFQSDPGDSDCYGGQQYVPLLNIAIS